jgi:hypothetical protein
MVGVRLAICTILGYSPDARMISGNRKNRTPDPVHVLNVLVRALLQTSRTTKRAQTKSV